LGDVLKKKESTESTSTIPTNNLESVQSDGSLDGVGSNGFPAIDKNLGVPGLKPDLKTVDQLANPPKSKATIQEKTTNKEDVKGFGEGLLNRLDTGIATISKSFYDAPKMILDAIYAPQNYLSEKLNIPSLKVDPETYAFENIPSKNMDEIIKNNNKKIENYKKEIGGDVVSAFDKGDYANTFKHAALNSMESVPLIVAAMATGGESLLANSLMIGSSASTQYDQLNKEHPEMGTGTKLANAAVNGALEVAVGKFMEGVGGNVWKNVLTKKGVKETAQIATNSFKKTLEKVVGDSPMVGVVGEYAEERITDGLQQLNDIATGASTEFNWNQNKNAGLSSLGFGLPNATALYGAKAYISNKTKKEVTKTANQITKLQNDLQNPNLSPEKKKIISQNISKIYDENKKILGDELQKLEIMPEKTKKELVGIDKNIDKIKEDAIDIKYDVNISPENKALLLKKLEQDFKDNINRKNEILSKTSEVEFLPLKEQDKIKRQALKELTAELNPDGKKNIEIDNAQITERANKIYKTQQENLIKEKDAKAEVPITETEVETEVQEPTEEQEVDNGKVKEFENIYYHEGYGNQTKGNAVYLGTKEVAGENAKPYEITAKKPYVVKNSDDFDIVQGFIDEYKSNNPESNWHPNTTDYVNSKLKELGYDSLIIKEEALKDDKGYENIGGTYGDAQIVVFDKSKIKEIQNAKISPTNTPVNGNVTVGAGKLGESGITKQESPAKESVSSSVDGGEVKGDVEVTIGKNNHKFYTGRKTKIEDFSKTKGEFIFFSKDKKVSEHYGGDNITEANVDTSGFLDLSTQEKKTAFVKENFTDEDIHKLYPNIKRNAFDRQTNIKGFEEIEKEIIQGYRTSLENNRFSGDGEVQNAILRKIKAKGHTGVVLEDSFFGKKDMSYVVFDKSVINSGKTTETPQPKSKGDAGKIIEPHSEVNTDVETVKQELKLDPIDSLIYDEFNNLPKSEISKKVDKIKDDKYGEIEKIESDINDLDIKIEDNGIEIDQINDAENLTPAKKKKAVAEKEKEYKEFQKQQKELESKKEATEKFLEDFENKLFHSEEDFNQDAIDKVLDKVNTRLETRKAVKNGTDLFPETANIPELEKTPSRKEKRIKATEAKIDDLANALKDLLPSVPNTDGLKNKVYLKTKLLISLQTAQKCWLRLLLQSMKQLGKLSSI